MKTTITALEWGNIADERNNNLDRYSLLKTEEEKQVFIKNLKALHYENKARITE